MSIPRLYVGRVQRVVLKELNSKDGKVLVNVFFSSESLLIPFFLL